jgi:hypothetical protein
MNIRDFRIGWRTLVQEPVYSLVVIAGLAIGLATSMLLLGFVHYSWQYNAQIPNVERVYVVKQQFNIDPKSPWFDLAPLMLRNVAAKLPGVEAATAYIPSRPQGSATIKVDGQLRSVKSLTVLPGFTEMLGLQALEGDLAIALDRPDQAVLTEASAIRFYGTPHAVGRTLEAEGKLLRVGAIVRTPPANTTIPFEAIIGTNSEVMDADFREELLTGAHGWWGKLLIRVHPGASISAIETALQEAIDHDRVLNARDAEAGKRLGKRKPMELMLAPLRTAYFDQDIASNYISPPGERAHPVVVAGLALVALLILALAAINYVNLATVGMLRRQREIAMRKVLGARMPQIVLQLLAESLLVSMLATLLGLLLAWLALPMFGQLVNRTLDGMLTPMHVLVALGVGAAMGVLTASYPAWIAMHVRPSEVLAGRAETESARGMRLRRVMTVLQLATAMGFASVTLAIIWQSNYAMNASPGFDPAPLLIVDLLDDDKDQGRMPHLVAALSAQPGITGVARSQDAVGRHNSVWQREMKQEGGGNTAVEMKWVSANFFEIYGLKPQAGRLFDSHIDKEGDALPVILNAAATRELGFSSPEAAVGKTVFFIAEKPTPKRVIGIAPDLRFESLHEMPRAVAYELFADGHTLSVRFNGSPAQAQQAVRTLWPSYYPELFLTMRSAGEILADDYAEDIRMAKLLSIATGIALAIAAFGTYVLSAHTVQRRAREIVLRKLHGAGRGDIGLLVLREIGALALVAAVVGLPIAGVVIARYLAGYVERAPIGYWTLLAALSATLAIAIAAAARHAWLAMRMQPAAALRV